MKTTNKTLFYKNALTLIAVFTILIITYIMSMSAVYAIPNSLIEKNTIISLERIEKHGLYPRIALTARSTLDHFTDKIMLETSLQQTGYALNDAMIPSYYRYWHGYQIFLRPLLCIMPEQLMWCLLVIIFIFLFYKAFIKIIDKSNIDCAIAFLFSFAMSYPYVAPFSLQYVNVYVITLIAIIAICSEHNIPLYTIFFIVGSLINFMDLLTFPVISLGFPLTIVLVMQMREQSYSLKDGVSTVVISSTMWGLGYIGTWISKWVLSYVILGHETFATILSSCMFRIAGGSVEDPLSYYQVFQDNLLILLLVTPEVWGAIGITTLIVMHVRHVQLKTKFINFWLKIKQTNDKTIPLGLVAAIPVCWYLILANHSQIHEHFTFRIITVSIFAGLMLIDYTISQNSLKLSLISALVATYRHITQPKKIIISILMLIFLFI